MRACARSPAKTTLRVVFEGPPEAALRGRWLKLRFNLARSFSPRQPVPIASAAFVVLSAHSCTNLLRGEH
jgi:hypothetical protein